jgi:hypothetical protein
VVVNCHITTLVPLIDTTLPNVWLWIAMQTGWISDSPRWKNPYKVSRKKMVPDAGGVGAARSVLDGVAATRFLSIFFLLLVLIYSSLHACHFFPFSCRCSIGPCFRVETRFISLHNSQLARIASCIILST